MGDHVALLEVARAETGLSDFGNDSFREGLEILVRALRDEARLNALGESVLRQRLIVYLKQRLQVEDWYRRHPEIEDVPLKAPLIGISLPRTGSTALSCLLAEDPDTRSLRAWEAAQPCPPPSTVKGPDPRITEGETSARPEGSKAHVPSTLTGPMECQELMALDFKSQFFLALAQVPSYAQWLLDADLTTTYLYERRVLKLLQWGYPAKPWRLKCPTHLGYLEHLNVAFPDARFVMTHRDPSEVMVSVATVYADYVSKFTDHTDLHYLGKLNTQQWTEAMARAQAFRDNGNDARFYDIEFRAMQRDPIGQVRGLYRWLGEPVTEAFETGMAQWWRENAENREPSVHPDPAIYGLDLEKLRHSFANYTARIATWTRRDSAHGH